MLEILPGRVLDHTSPCFFIAEIGQNHQGSFEEAQKLITAARLAGADCVKFQKTDLHHKFTKFALQRPYESEHSWGKTYGEHKNHLEFSEEQFRALQLFAKNENIAFTASAKDIPSLKFLQSIDVPFVKIGSGDSDDVLLLQEASKSGKPLVISTGMLNLESVHCVYQMVKKYHNKFALLQCTSSYPTEMKDVNLKVIKRYRKEFPDIVVGYSGHEIGNAVSVAAVTFGAKIIERHITLNKNQKGSDHACSLLPEEFESMVTDIRNVEYALGTSKKKLLSCEIPCYEKLGKSLVAARDLALGTRITESDMNIKVGHPKGIPAENLKQVIGMRLKKNLVYDETIQQLHLEY